MIYGCSTTLAPSHPKNKKLTQKAQKKFLNKTLKRLA
jgi:hypothetical protein